MPGGNRPSLGLLAFISLLPAVLMGVCCYLITANSLDLFIGGIFMACLLTPPLAAIAGQLPGAVCSWMAISIGMSCSWFLPVWERSITAGQGLACVLVLCTLLLVLISGVLLLMRLGCSRMISSSVVSVFLLAWLSFPIWMSGALSGSQLRWSVLLHPLFAINGIVPQLGIWTEQQVAYGLTNIGQDVQYQLPRSAWPVIGFQSSLAVVMLLIRGVSKAKRPARGKS